MDTNSTPQQSVPMSSPSRSTKRSRENEDEALRIKREKAAERQRRKRERDRSAVGLNSTMGFPPQNGHEPQLQPEHQPERVPAASNFNGEELSPEEIARRDRVRANARERQRKHRSLQKQKKLRELGLDMGNEIMPGMGELPFRPGNDGHYQQIIPHELQHHPHPLQPHEPPFPQGQALGQIFASTLLVSFSQSPTLKQHLLRTHSMTNEELASLEPVIADAWDQWDHQRRLHYAEQAANAAKAAGRSIAGPSIYPSVELNELAVNPYTNNGDPNQPTPNEFRARFHRSLVAPSPFRTFPTDGPMTATTSTPSSSGSVQQPDPIDPHLTAASATGTGAAPGTGTVTGSGSGPTSESRQKPAPSCIIDPDLGQARGEAENTEDNLAH